MFGAIAGDVIGSSYEFNHTKSYTFELFTPQSSITDDTVLTVAVADCLLHGKDYATTFKEYGNRFPYAGYGGMFARWLGSDDSRPYYSFGNGSAMRVSPVGFAFSSLEQVLQEAEKSAAVTHNHPEGIKGAQAIAASIFLAKSGSSKEEIRQYIENTFNYDLRQTLAEIRPHYYFNETCQGSVPQAIIAFLESTDYEDAIRKAVSLGGDSDTLACMTGGIAQAFYKDIPVHIIKRVRALVPDSLLEIIDEFNLKYGLYW
ncbi:MAG: ADP-ribosylglycohydrolase family protein [Dehalococcoidales bacterium]|jgi:ADP-ribosylglycohydrolase|nr:ADP-ribosylglycohydrolase family protein [Dehalococcoidales bacterium]